MIGSRPMLPVWKIFPGVYGQSTHFWRVSFDVLLR